MTEQSPGNAGFGIAIKLGLVLAAFGVLASGLTGYYTYHTTREILVKEASRELLQSTLVLGRRFSIMAGEAAKDARFLAQIPHSRDITGSGQTAEALRLTLAVEYKSLLQEHPEYFQIRFISAQRNGIELVRVDRDGAALKVISSPNLQEKGHYPYVYETLKLMPGQVHFSGIFINREEGAHAGHKQPTLQVASPVMGDDGRVVGVVVLNVDLNRLFGMLKADMGRDYQLYLTNQNGDFLIHPDSARTFGFDYGRRFLVQDTFSPVAAIIDRVSETATVRTVSAEGHDDVIGGFSRIPFGDTAERRFVVIGLTVPLNIVLAETDALARNSSKIVIGFSLLAIILSILVAYVFVRPLKRLVAAVQRFSATRELTPSPRYRNDELGMLARCIDQMQAHIVAHLNILNMRSDEMEHQSRHDALTGAPNRVMFMDRLEFAMANAHRHGLQLAVMFIDIDHFKQINDCYGHAAGDAVLIAVVQRLKATVRESDSVARMSGDEFVMMIQPVDDTRQLSVIAQKVIDTLHEPVLFEGQTLQVGASIGISVYPQDGANTKELLHNADAAMYRSKQNGRNNFNFYS